jgi:hypothetical protein
MSKLETELDKLIQLIKPAERPPFDWYVPWQDHMMHRQPLTLRAAGMNPLVEGPGFPDEAKED